MPPSADRGGAGASPGAIRSSPKKLLDNAVMVEKAAEYCRQLAENWRQDVAKKSAEFARLDLVHIVQEAPADHLFRQSGHSDLAGLAWKRPLQGAKFELMRIFQNLFKNSMEAEAKTVTATFSSRATASKAPVIVDDGAGMDPDRVRRALGGGFTSKESGLGLGLSIVRHIIHAHGGDFPPRVAARTRHHGPIVLSRLRAPVLIGTPAMRRRRVKITGIGPVTPARNWPGAVLEGDSGAGEPGAAISATWATNMGSLSPPTSTTSTSPSSSSRARSRKERRATACSRWRRRFWRWKTRG